MTKTKYFKWLPGIILLSIHLDSIYSSEGNWNVKIIESKGLSYLSYLND